MGSTGVSVGLRRRQVLQGLGAGAGAIGLAGCGAPLARTAPPLAWDPRAIAPLRAQADRIFDITVCSRPFRAAGPRLDTERVGDKLIVHNYGHGGSGWSLSWGSGTMAVRQAMAASPREIAVIGCGALGLTAAVLAQRAGAKVTIYARDLLPQTRSARATGSWTPDSRIALTSAAPTNFGDTWEEMARTSFKQFRNYLGLPGTPVEWIDRYSISDEAMTFPRPPRPHREGELDFASYNSRVRDLTPRQELMPPGSTPFNMPYVYRGESLTFNIANYGHTLLMDFLAAGGTLQRREFHAPQDLTALPEPVIINCPGYAAREWWKDETVTPVRGQIAWLIPQPEVTYGLSYQDVSMLSRRDGIVIQDNRGGEMKGVGDATEVPDRAEADAALAVIRGLFDRFGLDRAPRRAA